jgi:hypothetical protein
MPAAVRRIAIYLRRSTDDEHQPFSISAQEAALLNYIASQSGWTLVAKYSDDASGATTGRPDLQRALTAARAGRFDVLLVVRVDRFSRRLSAPASPPCAPRSASSRPATTRSPTPSATSPPHPHPPPSNSSAPTCTTPSTPAPPPSARPPSKPSSLRSASSRKDSSPCSESPTPTAPSPEKPPQPAPARSRFAQWCDRWGGWGSNPGPAEYESRPPAGSITIADLRKAGLT